MIISCENNGKKIEMNVVKASKTYTLAGQTSTANAVVVLNAKGANMPYLLGLCERISTEKSFIGKIFPNYCPQYLIGVEIEKTNVIMNTVADLEKQSYKITISVNISKEKGEKE